MSLLKIISTLLLFLIFIGCDSTTNNDSGAGTKINVGNNDLVDEDGTLASESSVEVKTFNVKKGYSYSVDIDQDDYDNYDLDYFVISSAGDTILEDNFKADSASVYSVIIFADYVDPSYTGTIGYSLTINEQAPLSTDLNGKWVLVSENYTYKSYSQSFTYSTSNADEVIEFRNDSIYRSTYDEYEEDSIYTRGYLAVGSWLFDLNVNINGNKLTFSLSNSSVSGSFVYEKFTGSLSDITWEEENASNTVPTSMLGTWYVSYEKEIGEEHWEGESEYFDDEETYNNGGESYEILVLTTDSVTIYSNDGFGQFSKYTESIEEYSYMLKYASMENGKIVVKEVECEIEGSNWYGYYAKEEYSPYTGDLPPTEWLEFDLPTTYTDVNLSETKSGTLAEKDTIWYRISVTSGSEYTFKIDNAEFDTYFSMLNESKELVDSNDDWGDDLISLLSFTAAEDGYYYIALTGFSSSSKGTYSLSFTEGLTTNGRVNKKLKNKCLINKDLFTKKNR